MYSIWTTHTQKVFRLNSVFPAKGVCVCVYIDGRVRRARFNTYPHCQIRLAWPRLHVSQSCAGGSDVIRALAALSSTAFTVSTGMVCDSTVIRLNDCEKFSMTLNRLSNAQSVKNASSNVAIFTPPGANTSELYRHFFCVSGFLLMHHCNFYNHRMRALGAGRTR